MKSIVTFTAAALTLVAVTGPAHAADAAPRKTVAYADLDMSSAAGVETFNRRVRTAAKTVCGDAPAFRPLAENLRIARCVDGAIERNRRTTA